MKKSMILAVCALAMAFTACEDEVAQKYLVTVNVTADGADMSSIQNFDFTVVNETGESISVNGDSASYSKTFEVVAGTYTLTATGSTDDFNYAASTSVTVSAEATVNLIMAATPKQESGIIFKEVYFSGVNSYYFMDGYYELVNNSDEVKYLDGILMGIVVCGYGDPSPWATTTDSVNWTLPDFYPLTNHCVYFPGNGTEYPLQPGQSVVCATKAIDHSSRDLEDGDDPSPVNLSNADWDIYITSQSSDIDNPDVPNMLNAWDAFGFDFMPATSGQSLILAKLPENISVEDFVADPENIKTYEGGWSSNLCIPSEYVLDAIDVIYFNEEHLINKCILTKDDAGYILMSGSDDEWTSPMYTGRSLRRKCTMVNTEGRAYFKDSNNSSVDFVQYGQTPVPHRTFTTAD